MKRIVARFALVALALSLSVVAYAKTQSQEVTLYHDSTLNGTTIPAGDYVVKYDTEGQAVQVKFVKGKKEVASANGQVKTLTSKPSRNQVVMRTEGNTQSISEIQFRGSESAISFDSTGTTAGK